MITILDYGLGNVRAFLALFDRIGIKCVAATSPSDVSRGSKIIIPGVGAFDSAMERLERSGLAAAVRGAVEHHRTPVLGVCVGMQVLFETSDEGDRDGLGLLPGSVKQLTGLRGDTSLCLPHLGWNTVSLQRDDPLMHELDQAEFYFLHSYRVCPTDGHDVIATTTYGCKFPSIVGNGVVSGVQFHPEKSHVNGVRLLTNFTNAPWL